MDVRVCICMGCLFVANATNRGVLISGVMGWMQRLSCSHDLRHSTCWWKRNDENGMECFRQWIWLVSNGYSHQLCMAMLCWKIDVDWFPKYEEIRVRVEDGVFIRLNGSVWRKSDNYRACVHWPIHLGAPKHGRASIHCYSDRFDTFGMDTELGNFGNYKLKSIFVYFIPRGDWIARTRQA